jgi:hypothetical protein
MHDVEKVLHGDIIDPHPPRRRREIDPLIYYVEVPVTGAVGQPFLNYFWTWRSYVVYPSSAVCR